MLFSHIFPVTCHTRHVGPGSTFVAIPGYKDDGLRHIECAIKKGATTIVVQKKEKSFFNQYENVNVIVVNDARKALAELSNKALGNPASKLKIIGITGTKGKTTTTYTIEHFLRSAGHKTALLGGVKNKILNNEESSLLTTPSSDYLHMFFAQCVQQGVEYVVMEVSAHALSLQRVHAVQFDAVGFTNLDAEHLDFYKTLKKYFQAKIALFSHVKKDGVIVINRDNEWGQKALELLKNDKRALGFGQCSSYKQDALFLLKKDTLDGLELMLKQDKNNFELNTSKLFGQFNAYNISMATLICLQLGLSAQAIQMALQTFPGVPGRLQLHQLKNGAKAFVDYAHNPSSMQAVLQALRPLSDHVIVVFGCGGDRDATKRPVMGRLAVDLCDDVIVTDDNPRTEDPEKIMQEIVAGIPHEKMKKVICEHDRKKAIAQATALSRQNSVIALLGKGHETSFIYNNKTFYFSDLEEISQF